jgi:hypothetical protein
MHINDWAAIQTLFDKLNKQLEKTQKVTQALGVPRVYVKLLVELEDFLNKTLAGESVMRWLMMESKLTVTHGVVKWRVVCCGNRRS